MNKENRLFIKSINFVNQPENALTSTHPNDIRAQEYFKEHPEELEKVNIPWGASIEIEFSNGKKLPREMILGDRTMTLAEAESEMIKLSASTAIMLLRNEYMLRMNGIID